MEKTNAAKPITNKRVAKIARYRKRTDLVRSLELPRFFIVEREEVTCLSTLRLIDLNVGKCRSV